MIYTERLKDWTIRFELLTEPTVAVCRHRSKTIVVNTYFLPELLHTKRLDEIIGHELAHALLPPEAQHKYVWKRMCRLLTVKARRVYSL